MDFEIIYKEYWDKVFRLCMGYINDHDLARDMAQETFIKVWQHLPDFRNEATVGTWIFRIATNHCLRQLEQQRRMPSADFPVDLSAEDKNDIEPQIQLLYKSIAELPEIDRIIISLELEDVRQAEIAQIVGLSESNIRVRIHRIKEVLTKKMRKDGN